MSTKAPADVAGAGVACDALSVLFRGNATHAQFTMYFGDVSRGPICAVERRDLPWHIRSAPEFIWFAMDFDFIDRLADCTTSDAVGATFSKVIRRYGYTTTAARQFTRRGTTLSPRWLFRDQPAEWATISDELNIARHSPIIAEARVRQSIFSWDDIQAARAPTPNERKIWHAIDDFGWKNGLTIPIHSPRGDFAYVSFSSKERDLDLSAGVRSRLQIVAFASLGRCLDLTDIAAPKEVQHDLSARELECLRWVAMGKTDWEVGEILSISQTTVKFHIDRARLKLRATNRPHAVAMLALRGGM